MFTLFDCIAYVGYASKPDQDPLSYVSILEALRYEACQFAYDKTVFDEACHCVARLA